MALLLLFSARDLAIRCWRAFSRIAEINPLLRQ
jgi:hypothetical protein